MLARPCLGTLAVALLISPVANADQPLTQLNAWSGSMDFFATGAPLAIDGPDGDTTLVDTLLTSASVEVTSADIPATATPTAAYLYWSGSIVNDDCTGTTIDDEVGFLPPGAAMATTVTADVCFCSDADATSYDQQVCRKDVTSLITDMIGTYTVSDFNALVMNFSTNNASFSMVFVYSDPALPPRRIGLWDGVQTMAATVNASETITLSGLNVDNPAEGDLTWYVAEGDIGGSMGESVSVATVPSGGSLTLSDAINPVDNPMNKTINTTTPPQTNTIGVDIDRFDLSSALDTNDTALDITYTAGDDKWWIAYNIVGVNVFEPAFGAGSSKTVALQGDADGNGTPSVGDTMRYTVDLVNSGTAPGVVLLTDVIPAEAASWQMVGIGGGGTDGSTLTDLSVTGISVAAGDSAQVVFDVVIDDVADETVMSNTALFDATPDGDSGSLVAPDVIIRRDGDGDTVFDNDDNCPQIANTDQADDDNDGLGNVCDPDFGGDTGGGGAGGNAMGGSSAGGSSAGGSAAGGAASGGAGGTAGPGPSGSGGSSDDDDVESDGSCGCHVVGSSNRWSSPWAMLVALGAVAVARRRRI